MSRVLRCSPDGAYSQSTTSDVPRPLGIDIATLINPIAIKVYETMLNFPGLHAIAKPDELCAMEELKDRLVKLYIRQKVGTTISR
jgi:hypothetical protein